MNPVTYLKEQGYNSLQAVKENHAPIKNKIARYEELSTKIRKLENYQRLPFGVKALYKGVPALLGVALIVASLPLGKFLLFSKGNKMRIGKIVNFILGPWTRYQAPPLWRFVLAISALVSCYFLTVLTPVLCLSAGGVHLIRQSLSDSSKQLTLLRQERDRLGDISTLQREDGAFNLILSNYEALKA